MYESGIDVQLKYGVRDVCGVKILKSTSFQKCWNISNIDLYLICSYRAFKDCG